MAGRSAHSVPLDPQALTPDNGEVERLSRDQVQKFLAGKTLFRECSTQIIDQLSGLPLQKVVPKGCKFFSMGQTCEALHFVAQGCGLLVKVARDGRQFILQRVTVGQMVGAVAFFDKKPYPASFVADSECVMLSFPRDRLMGFLAADSNVTLAVVGGVVAQLRAMISKVEQMSFDDTAQRLWDYLVKGSRGPGRNRFPRTFEPLPTREHIANAIGTVREVVSRRLSRLVDSGHVQIERRRLTLLKPLK